MTLKKIKEYYNVTKMDGYYNLFTLNVRKNSRTVHKYLCTIYKVGDNKFRLNGYKPVSKFDDLQKQIKSYLNSLEYDSSYYCPSYIKGTAQDWLLYDLLSDYGFKRGGWSEPSGFNLKRPDIYGGNCTALNLDYSIDSNNDTVEITLSMTNNWVSVKSDFNLKNVHDTLDGLLKPLFLTEAISNIKTSDKMTNNSIDLVLKSIEGLDITTSKVDLKKKLLELAKTL
tara:strand:- start:73 stop:750 length:678 start_codon:yes stop_codon:yes gene_type:complete